MAKYDIVSIGDTTIDAFIELHEASVHCNLNHGDCQLCLSYANKIPFEQLTVLPACGNSANNAIGSSRLGLKDAYIGAIGNDAHGQDILNELKREKVATNLITINKGVPTNYHFVLVYRGERTILIKHQKFAYKIPANLDTKWIYFSSMAGGTEKFHKEIDRLLKKHKDIKVAFNPGTFQMRMGTKALGGIYKRTEILFLNREEAQLVTQQTTRSIRSLIHAMHKLGSKIAVVTDGRAGAYASDGRNIWFLDHYPGPLIEATGCGDAFGTAFTAAIFYGKSLPEAMRWGAINGGNVALHVGPHEGLQSRSQIESWIKKHPKFKPKEYTK
jgi:sugar/nucleoside kinase (ribokinase family)